jgi:hypothetical protein
MSSPRELGSAEPRLTVVFRTDDERFLAQRLWGRKKAYSGGQGNKVEIKSSESA